ncbi:SOUL family heme-binding protein [Methanolobus bombayensis]|uniref:SOUL family heme-binding protein n=1 Tax=Methanolobus bombayensis TaxID=38023 RepID=UPI001AE52A05|nr:heme-binding protein [Methanolobus bombayensis]MBP1908245.1 effector-binding domain-containing protein [Methanolobus bombayensis]
MDKAGVVFALLTVFTVMLGSWFFAGVHVSMTTEEVEYRVMYELEEDVEVRKYDELTVISTSANNQNDAFSVLASYIFGNNAGKKKIDMTSPVITSESDNVVNMSFVLPAEYNIDNAPDTENPEISIQAIPARKVAVIRFSGYAKDEIIEKKRSVLSSQLADNGIVTTGDFFLMQYNPPWVPPTLMRNEVAIEVE